MFERYQRNQHRVLDVIVTLYDRARELTGRADQELAFRIDDYRRRWRRHARVDELVHHLAETAAALGELESELDRDVAQGLRASRDQVHWLLAELRR